MTDQRLSILRMTAQLTDASDAALRSLLPHLDEANVRAGETLAREGAACHQLIIVASGQLSARRDGGATFLGGGDVYGWEAMRERGLNDATVVALADSHLYLMSHAQFRAAVAVLSQQKRPAATSSRPWKGLRQVSLMRLARGPF
jgi:CRP-like cAMP-binding protein